MLVSMLAQVDISTVTVTMICRVNKAVLVEEVWWLEEIEKSISVRTGVYCCQKQAVDIVCGAQLPSRRTLQLVLQLQTDVIYEQFKTFCINELFIPQKM